MFPQLVSYQASLPPPPPPPPACPTGCPSTCYPNCDAGCCFPVSQPPAYPQYPPNPYDTGYAGYPTGDPCAAQSCSAACAPLCKPGEGNFSFTLFGNLVIIEFSHQYFRKQMLKYRPLQLRGEIERQHVKGPTPAAPVKLRYQSNQPVPDLLLTDHVTTSGDFPSYSYRSLI